MKFTHFSSLGWNSKTSENEYNPEKEGLVERCPYGEEKRRNLSVKSNRDGAQL